MDLDERNLLEPIRIADGGEVKLSLSSSGRLLGVVAEKFVDAEHHSSVLKAFSLEGGALVEKATMSVVLPCAVSDVAVLERTSRLLLAGKKTHCWDFCK